MIKRYVPAKTKADRMVQVTNGDYVLYTDHAAEVSRLEGEVAELRHKVWELSPRAALGEPVDPQILDGMGRLPE